jgi:hypothetical protein
MRAASLKRKEIKRSKCILDDIKLVGAETCNLP